MWLRILSPSLKLKWCCLMNMRLVRNSFFVLLFPMMVAAQVTPTRQTPVHDPVMIKQDSTYYLFCTGFGITVFSSQDMQNWRREKPVFEQPPEWAVKTVPGYRGH